LQKKLRELKREMKKAAENLEFEKAAQLRDMIKELSDLELRMGGDE
jgi:excinuclease ABC subunit B